MLKLEKPSSLQECAARLITLGYKVVPIPGGSKGPSIPGWEKLNLTAEDVATHWPTPDMLIGVLHTNTAALDIDVYDEDLAAKIIREGKRRFPGALERIGEAPKSALWLRVDGPVWRVQATRKRHKGSITAQVDIRAHTRQTVVYGRHPDTKQPYRWPGRNLWETPRTDLPILTQEDAQLFRDWCEAEIAAWADKEPKNVTDFERRRFAIIDDERPTEQMFIEALTYVSPSSGHDDGWCQTLMGIHDFYNGSAAGLETAKDWSSADPRYTPKEVEAKWRSFEAGRGVSYRTVLHLAKEGGANLREMRRKHQPQASTFNASGFKASVDPADDAQTEAPKEAPFQSWEVINPFLMPARDFIYGKHYIRKFASITVAPGGLGKSTLVLAECIAIATGKAILGITPKSRERVVYFNAEDPKDEINRRVIAMLMLHNIGQEELVGWFFNASGRETELIFSRGEDGDIVEPVFALIEDWHVKTGAAVYAFDPLANMTESPETNDVFRRLGKRLSLLADKLNCSIEIVHHTRKLNGKEAEVEDSRGGGALIGAVRAARALNPMTADEAAKAGLDTHIDYFRIEAAGKNNLARPSAHASWFKRVSIELPNGDHVAAIEPWEWPDAFDGISTEDARMVRNAVAARRANPPRESPQSTDWVGLIVADVLHMDVSDKADKARIISMIKTWIKTGVLKVEKITDSRQGRVTPIVVEGPNAPHTGAPS